MQTALAAETPGSSIRDAYLSVPAEGLKLLLALVSSDGVDAVAVRGKLNVADTEYRSLLNALQRQYLVDIVSGLDGDVVRETLRLTDHGEDVLTRLMERTYELPE